MWFKKIENWQKWHFLAIVGHSNYVSTPCVEQSLHGSSPCAEQSLHCILQGAEHICRETKKQGPKNLTVAFSAKKKYIFKYCFKPHIL